MSVVLPSSGSPMECLLEASPFPEGPLGSVYPDAAHARSGAKARLGHLCHTLESDVIPRLLQTHGEAGRQMPRPDMVEVAAFANALLHGDEAEVAGVLATARRRGQSIAWIYLELLAPVARVLGEWWSDDRCDFASVTVALGRLQRVLHELSPQFGREVEVPPNGRRILFSQHPDEQHSFGLAMVAEFFRRAGWEVLGGVGGAVPDPSALVASEWFDVVGFSLGTEQRAAWAAERIAAVRRESRNRQVSVVVGGSLIVREPGWATKVGADLAGQDAAQTVSALEQLLFPVKIP